MHKIHNKSLLKEIEYLFLYKKLAKCNLELLVLLKKYKKEQKGSNFLSAKIIKLEYNLLNMEKDNFLEKLSFLEKEGYLGNEKFFEKKSEFSKLYLEITILLTLIDKK
jgi:hypothetical protein